jgi:simple sugar transport system ATP-binding protein
MMLGQMPPGIQAASTEDSHAGLPVLSVRNLHCDGADNNERRIEVDALTVRAGQVVGIAGISGNGQNELMNLLTGERVVDSLTRTDCDIKISGHDVRAMPVQARRKLGLAFVPEERLGRGAVPPMGLDWNMLLTLDSSDLVRGGLVDRNALRRLGREVIERFEVKASGERASADGLSGGNLQKYIVGREISKQPALVLVAQPTWGVDVVAAAKIRQALVDLAGAGSAVLVVSEDLEELLQICNVLYVIADGRLSEPLEPAQISIEQIGVLMGGVRSEAAQ